MQFARERGCHAVGIGGDRVFAGVADTAGERRGEAAGIRAQAISQGAIACRPIAIVDTLANVVVLDCASDAKCIASDSAQAIVALITSLPSSNTSIFVPQRRSGFDGIAQAKAHLFAVAGHRWIVGPAHGVDWPCAAASAFSFASRSAFALASFSAFLRAFSSASACAF